MLNKTILLLSIVFAIALFDGCKKKDIVDVDADFVADWDAYWSHATMTILSDNNLSCDDESCGDRECWVKINGKAKIKGDYIYVQNKLGIYQKKFHIDEYPYNEITSFPTSFGFPPKIFTKKMVLTATYNLSNLTNETFYGN